MLNRFASLYIEVVFYFTQNLNKKHVIEPKMKMLWLRFLLKLRQFDCCFSLQPAGKKKMCQYCYEGERETYRCKDKLLETGYS